MIALKTLAGRFDGLARRERLLVFTAVAALIAGMTFLLAVDPALLRARALRGAIAERQLQLSSLRAIETELSTRLAQDVNAPVRAELQQADQALSAIEGEIQVFHRTLIPAQAMAQVLGGLLQRQSGIRLVSLRNLAPEPLTAERETREGASAAAKAKRPALLYRHGIELVVEGGYFDLLNYLTLLEKQSWRMLWSETRLTARYPVSRLHLKLHTLSLDESWLSV